VSLELCYYYLWDLGDEMQLEMLRACLCICSIHVKLEMLNACLCICSIHVKLEMLNACLCMYITGSLFLTSCHILNANPLPKVYSICWQRTRWTCYRNIQRSLFVTLTFVPNPERNMSMTNTMHLACTSLKCQISTVV